MYENHFYRLEAGDRLSYLVKTSGREISIEFPKFHACLPETGLQLIFPVLSFPSLGE